MKSKSVWKYSIESESNRLIHCAHQIVVGFYKTNNFIVLPINPSVNNTHIVSFPNYPYTKIPRFWEKVKKVDVNDLPVIIDKDLLSAVSKTIESKIKVPEFEKTKSLWSKAEKNIISEIYKILPSKKGQIKKIEIYPTSFGTNCSFNWISKKGKIIIFLREDQGIYAITEAIITSLTRNDIYMRLEGLWQESEIITDFLVTETSIAKVLQKYERHENYVPTLKGTRIKEQAKLFQESNEYCQKIGIPNFKNPFGYDGMIPKIFNRPTENLTNTEKAVLLTLIKKQNTVIDIEEIGNIMFESEDNFSLYAISKMIQRLRDKLEVNGISGSYIQTLRGRGYLLKN